MFVCWVRQSSTLLEPLGKTAAWSWLRIGAPTGVWFRWEPASCVMSPVHFAAALTLSAALRGPKGFGVSCFGVTFPSPGGVSSHMRARGRQSKSGGDPTTRLWSPISVWCPSSALCSGSPGSGVPAWLSLTASSAWLQPPAQPRDSSVCGGTSHFFPFSPESWSSACCLNIIVSCNLPCFLVVRVFLRYKGPSRQKGQSVEFSVDSRQCVFGTLSRTQI